ncbi:AAA family ATPase [Micromonospora sp. CPCC 205711]|uniref:AAA family ATPase n=1 Tax=Micromonospora sp. CPCC 205547 TaxID=3122400 RepID=UPI002FF43956
MPINYELPPEEQEKRIKFEVEKLRIRAEAKRRFGIEQTSGQDITEDDFLSCGDLFDLPDETPAVWGKGSEVLMAEGESLMIAGPTGVGKTTVAGQLIRGRLGLDSEFLGLPIKSSDQNVLWLMMDRPQQIMRSIKRQFSPSERDLISQKLKRWIGPPPVDFALDKDVIVRMAKKANADFVVVDSVKDAALGLAKDEVGAAYNRTRQRALAEGIQLLELHHTKKTGANGDPPNNLEGIYGSGFLTNGAGSVILIWGEAGDPIVEFKHLKQPADIVGQGWKLHHDPESGKTVVGGTVNLLELVNSSVNGITALDGAKAMFETAKPTSAQKEKARRILNKLESEGRVFASEPTNKTEAVRYQKLIVKGLTK